MLTSLNHWTAAVESGSRTDELYSDFSKPFDEVQVDKLLIKAIVVGNH